MPVDRRCAVAALLALDETLGRIVRTTREPMVGQMRLTWWHGALTALDTAPAPAEPVLSALARDVLPLGVTGAELATMIDGWEQLLDGDTLDDAAYASERGGVLFAVMATAIDAAGTAAIVQAGEGWALADLSRHLSDPDRAFAARNAAAVRLSEAFADRWPVSARPIGMLALLAKDDIRRAAPRPGSPRRLARMAMHRIWGR